MAIQVTKDTPVEDLMEAWPGLVKFLVDEGLPCLVCGEPFWGSIGELAAGKHWDDTRITALVEKIQTSINAQG